MNTANIGKYLVIGVLAVILFWFIGSFISISNRDKQLRNVFTQKISERTTFYDKMWKTLSQKSQITIKNDSSFQNIVNLQVTGQKTSENTMMVWIQQSNPSASFTEVSKLYQELSLAVEAEREGFYEREKDLQSVKLQHDNLIDMFPGSLILSILGREKLIYKPITSDITDEVIKSGKDNNTKLF